MRLWIVDRAYGPGDPRREIAYSDDAGVTWHDPHGGTFTTRQLVRFDRFAMGYSDGFEFADRAALVLSATLPR